MMKEITKDCIEWIKSYYEGNSEGKAIIGISGGKDSTIAAALCVEALGADRVIGVMMPDGYQKDIKDSHRICNTLDIKHHTVNIGMTMDSLTEELDEELFDVKNAMYYTNTPARMRMTVLYAVATFYPNSRVVNTCNRSEDFVGYSTKFGDAAGDFSPLGNLTVREVLEIGDDLGLPYGLVHKAPADGMCDKTDEDNLGFTYQELDDFILDTGEISEETYNKIKTLHDSTRHKYMPMPTFDPRVGEYWRKKAVTNTRKLGLLPNAAVGCARPSNPGTDLAASCTESTGAPSTSNYNVEKILELMDKIDNKLDELLGRQNNE